MVAELSPYQTFDLNPEGLDSQRANALLKAMGNPHRLYVLHQLINGEKSVGELEKLLGLSQSALSQHLARLRWGKLVKTRRQAQTIYYSLEGDQATRIIDTLFEIFSDFDGSPALGADEANRGRAVTL